MLIKKKEKKKRLLRKNWIYSKRLLNFVDSILDSFTIDVYINQRSVCYEIFIMTIIFATISYHEIVKIFKLYF